MKVIISHDIDHISAVEHIGDFFISKFLMRNCIELAWRSISFKEFNLRISDLIRNKLQNIPELIEFDLNNSMKPTFFIGVNNGCGLAYNYKENMDIVRYISDLNIPIGVHGIEYSNFDGIKKEYETFKSLSVSDSFGIRMHYLRLDANTINYLNSAGYSYDTSTMDFNNPWKCGQMWEFPVQLMDSEIFYNNSRFQRKSLEIIKNDTIKAIEKCESSDLRYLTIITHDFYFSESFKKWKNWYIWLIDYLNSKGYQFINFNEAVIELNKYNDNIIT